ncbi:MAG: methyltransferase domain-containing protein [Acidobacteriota bacterium]
MHALDRLRLGGLARELRGAVVRGLRPSRASRLRRYRREGGWPWTEGYAQHKQDLIVSALDSAALDAFGNGETPAGWGLGVDERCVEIPWLFARLRALAGTDCDRPARILDAGSALNYEAFVARPPLAAADLHIATLAPEPNCYWRRGISYLFADLRRLPVGDGWYDVVASVSTLEHVGFSNRDYGVVAEHEAGEAAVAIAELMRVLRPGGRLLVTVPFGLPHRFATQCVFDRDALDALSAAVGDAPRRVTFFRYDDAGWRGAHEAEAATAEFVPWIALPAAERRRTPPPRTADRAAAARAVACLEWRRPER